MNKVQDIYSFLKKKYFRSTAIFFALNMFSFVLAASLIILNLFAIRFNPARDSDGRSVLWLFVMMSIFSGLAGVLSALTSFFVFRKKSIRYREQVESIEKELDLFKRGEGVYATEEGQEKSLVNQVTKILSE